ncbi:MAG: SUMF1/EgtB/PvdO family nonheme iron enzyme [Deltaproteobacteria bacterium]|nr:SUMF1/EgtB/PvdO family nonheme iron enzyme [Deltaproteobacteria bacterium]
MACAATCKLDARACFDRGVAQEAQHPQRAHALFELACANGVLLGCFNVAEGTLQGRGTAQDDALAARLFLPLCDRGEPRSCSNLGWLKERGRGTPIDLDGAQQFYQRGCDGKEMAACTNLGVLLDNRFSSAAYAKSAALFLTACNGNHGAGCYNLAAAYDRGRGVELDLAEGMRWYRKGCDLGHDTACLNLGLGYIRGEGAPQDFAEGAVAVRRACALGRADGCLTLATMHKRGDGVARDETAARGWTVRACELGNAAACARTALPPLAAPSPPPAPPPAPPPPTLTPHKASPAAMPDAANIRWVRSQGVDIAQTETTVAQYRACVDAGSCTDPDAGLMANWRRPGRDSHPINKVDHGQATAFCRWIGARLPTAAEWQAVASNGGTTKYPWGDEDPDGTRANYNDHRAGDGFDATAPVCHYSHGHNKDGVCDLAGNVFEWTATNYDPEPELKELRGGSFYVQADSIAAAFRGRLKPSVRTEGLGFRCVR